MPEPAAGTPSAAAPATLEWALDELDAIAACGVAPILFGGWAKELLGAWPAAPHDDLDVLVVADGIEALDVVVAARGGDEVPAKRHAHKRAYLADGRPVELVLVVPAGGELVTDFYGRHRRPWLLPLGSPMTAAGRPIVIVTAANVVAYERDHVDVQEAMLAVYPGLREELVRRYGTPYARCRNPFPDGGPAAARTA